MILIQIILGQKWIPEFQMSINKCYLYCCLDWRFFED
jgi:hypothetical protein